MFRRIRQPVHQPCRVEGQYARYKFEVEGHLWFTVLGSWLMVKRHNIMTIDELIAEGERVHSRKAEGMIGEYVPILRLSVM